MKGDIAYVKLPRDLLESYSWRSLSINVRRFIDFLMIEQMRRGGKANGALLAPYNQLADLAGIGRRLIAPAIEEAQQLGLVECRRGVGRSPNSYALTWLRFGNGDPPSERWRFAVHEGEPHQCTKVNHKGPNQGFTKVNYSIEASTTVRNA
jgi:hypothetical protein